MASKEAIDGLLQAIKEVENSSLSFKELSRKNHLPSDGVVFPDEVKPENNAELVKICVGTLFIGTILIPGMTENKDDPERPHEYCLEILKEETDELGRKVGANYEMDLRSRAQCDANRI
jgi:hypothetical protein